MRMRHGARVALLLAVGAVGCAGPEKPSLGKAAPTTVVDVANNGFADVTVYVVQSGMRWRLGTVTGLSEQRFTLRPSTHGGNVHLLADPIGGSPGYLSPP
ncbi:MAG: hypothetical protein KY467_13280, partial [Gemmatimonadetes bacterium]|nr:hypothetical protein [Gemmatimonadota bacterium]